MIFFFLVTAMILITLKLIISILTILIITIDGKDTSAPPSAAGTTKPPLGAAASAINNDNNPANPTHTGIGGGSAVHKLLKNLATEPKKKTLTTLLFGMGNPTIVVGDSRGTVTVYRVFEPLIITHVGPMQQSAKLKKAVMRQTDPAIVAALAANQGTGHEDHDGPGDSNNNSHTPASPESS